MKSAVQHTAIGAIILAGGQSRRMGQDKARLRLVPAGPMLIEYVLRAVRQVAGRVVISTNAPERFAALGAELVADDAPGRGPLAGIAAGLAALGTKAAWAVGCDMPCLTPAVLHYLAEQWADDDAVVPLDRTGRAQPLCALYTATCLPIIRSRLAAGDLKLSAALDALRTRYIPATDLEPFDPEWRSFWNANTPEDLMALRRALAG